MRGRLQGLRPRHHDDLCDVMHAEGRALSAEGRCLSRSLRSAYMAYTCGNSPAASLTLRQLRNCGSCTACCDGWLQIEVRGYQVRPGKPCPFSVQHQCAIYGERPQHPCREFVCGWLVASSPLPDWMRPDRSDMIMLAADFVWRTMPVDVVVAAGEQPKNKALDWLKRFCAENKRLLIYQVKDEWFAFGPPAFQVDISEKIARGEKPWVD